MTSSLFMSLTRARGRSIGKYRNLSLFLHFTSKKTHFQNFFMKGEMASSIQREHEISYWMCVCVCVFCAPRKRCFLTSASTLNKLYFKTEASVCLLIFLSSSSACFILYSNIKYTIKHIHTQHFKLLFSNRNIKRQ